jgi:glycosyltransferase involved in cell wall biosynthesis
MQNVLSYYALTESFRQKMMEANDGPLNFVPIGRLRHLGLKAVWRKIRNLRADHITIAIEDNNARSLAGPLMLIATASGTPRIDILWPNNQRESVSRTKILRHALRLVGAQISSRIALRRAESKLSRLEAVQQPMVAVAERSNVVLYLDANLSSGIAAGGSVGHIKGVIEGFSEKGFDIDYAACKSSPSVRPGVRWLEVDPPEMYGFPLEINCYLFNGNYEKRVRAHVKENVVSFIYQRMSTHNFTGAQLRDELGIPLVLEFNGSEVWVAENWGERLRLHEIALRAESISLRNADMVVTVSKALGDQLAAAGVPQERIVVYPNCINPLIFDPTRFSQASTTALRQRLGVEPSAKLATFIGTFGMWHGVDFLARAIRRLIIEDREWLERHRLHFLLVGDGSKMPEVRELLAVDRFNKFVTLTGLVAQADAPLYLAASDIFLSPHMPTPDGSPFFGSPTKLFEYMAMAKPIVASDLDQIGAVLKGTYLDETPSPDGPLGELFAPADETGFIEALKKVVADPGSSTRMAERARLAALKSYTWERHVDAILQRMKILRLM